MGFQSKAVHAMYLLSCEVKQTVFFFLQVLCRSFHSLLKVSLCMWIFLYGKHITVCDSIVPVINNTTFTDHVLACSRDPRSPYL